MHPKSPKTRRSLLGNIVFIVLILFEIREEYVDRRQRERVHIGLCDVAISIGKGASLRTTVALELKEAVPLEEKFLASLAKDGSQKWSQFLARSIDLDKLARSWGGKRGFCQGRLRTDTLTTQIIECR